MAHPDLATIYLTRVHGQMDCDTHFPPIPAAFTLRSTSTPQTEGPVTYEVSVYDKASAPGEQEELGR